MNPRWARVKLNYQCMDTAATAEVLMKNLWVLFLYFPHNEWLWFLGVTSNILLLEIEVWSANIDLLQNIPPVLPLSFLDAVWDLPVWLICRTVKSQFLSTFLHSKSCLSRNRADSRVFILLEPQPSFPQECFGISSSAGCPNPEQH